MALKRQPGEYGEELVFALTTPLPLPRRRPKERISAAWGAVVPWDLGGGGLTGPLGSFVQQMGAGVTVAALNVSSATGSNASLGVVLSTSMPLLPHL